VNRTAAEQREYMRAYRSRPVAAAVNTWYSRTYTAAMRELARAHPAEFLAVLDRIRAADPRPEALEVCDAA
jgi:hypothetical protein